MQYKAIHKILPVLWLAQVLANTGYSQSSNKPSTATQVSGPSNTADPCENISYPQNFLAKDPGLISIMTVWAAHHPGNGDITFKLTRLKSNWNTYFTQLQYIAISEDDWNHEDLSGLTNLYIFTMTASGQVQDDPNSPLVPLDSTEIDNILIQIAAGAGPTVSNGAIGIISGGSNRTDASTAAYNYLVNSRGWTITIDTTTR
jgi:hypothetical protein